MCKRELETLIFVIFGFVVNGLNRIVSSMHTIKKQGAVAVMGPCMALSTDAIVSAGNIFIGLTGVDDIKTLMLACELTNAHLQLE